MVMRDGEVRPDELPFIDVHTVDVDAGIHAVWDALVGTVGSSFSGVAPAAFARIVGCAELSASPPSPLGEGSSLVGFRVATARRPQSLVLTGRHRFSTYALCFTVEETGTGGTRLAAESRALFPGVLGRAYRTAVISSGGHSLGVRRLLSGIARRAAAVAAASS